MMDVFKVESGDNDQDAKLEKIHLEKLPTVLIEATKVVMWGGQKYRAAGIAGRGIAGTGHCGHLPISDVSGSGHQLSGIGHLTGI